MTRFEKDLLDAKNRNEIEVLSKRKAELERIEKQGKACKNGFKRQCLAQEYARLKAEYDKIDSNF
nr:MAG TPA: Type III secretion system, cytoplasmic E component of needle [Caudoviricetes sp.]